MAKIDLDNTYGREVMLEALLDEFVTVEAQDIDQSREFSYTVGSSDFEITGDPAVIQLASDKKWTFNINQSNTNIDQFQILNDDGNVVVTIDPEETYEYTQTGTLEVTGITINLNDQIN